MFRQAGGRGKAAKQAAVRLVVAGAERGGASSWSVGAARKKLAAISNALRAFLDEGA
jgi:hypothetical protein